MRCEEPVKILENLRLTEQGYSQREIAQSIKCGKSTGAKIGAYSRDDILTTEDYEMLVVAEIENFGVCKLC